MVSKSLKKQILTKLIQPIFEDIGTGFTSRRPKGVENIKGERERTIFTADYLGQSGEALDSYIESALKVMKPKQVNEFNGKSEGELKISLEMPKEDATTNLLTDIKTALEGVKKNTTPLSFKEKVLAKKEDESDDKAMQELIKVLKDKEKDNSTVNEKDRGSLLGSLLGGSAGGIGIDMDVPDLDYDKKNTKTGKKGLWRKAKNFVKGGASAISEKGIVGAGATALATGARALGGLAVANPIAATVIGVGAAAYGGYKLWDNMRGQEDSKKVFDQLAKEGIIDHDIIGNSEILKWDMIKKLKPEDLELLIQYDDFSSEDKAKLQAILKNKKEQKKVQQVIDTDKKEKTRQKDSLRNDVKAVHGEGVDIDSKIDTYRKELQADKTFDFDSLSVEEKSELITKKAFLEKGSYAGVNKDTNKKLALKDFAKPIDVVTSTAEVAQNLETPDNKFGNINDSNILEKHRQLLEKEIEGTKNLNKAKNLKEKLVDLQLRLEELQDIREQYIPSVVQYNGVDVRLSEEDKHLAPTDDLEYINYIEDLYNKQIKKDAETKANSLSMSPTEESETNMTPTEKRRASRRGTNVTPTVSPVLPNPSIGGGENLKKVKISDNGGQKKPIINSGGYPDTKAVTGGDVKKVDYKMKGDKSVSSSDIKDLFDKGSNVKDININNLDENMLHNLKAMAAEYYEITGEKLRLDSAFRDPDYQAKLFKGALKKYGSYEAARKWVAPPGNSMHNYGLAVDIPTAQLNKASKSGLLAKYGFHRPMSHEGWHIEPIGIDRVGIRTAGKKNYEEGRPLVADSGVVKIPTTESENTDSENKEITAKIKEAKEVTSGAEPYQVSSQDSITKLPDTAAVETLKTVKDNSNKVTTNEGIKTPTKTVTKNEKPVILASNSTNSSTGGNFSKIDDTTLILLSNEE